MKIKTYIPFLDWIGTYNRQAFSSDVHAGLIVGIMLIPQGMAYAMIAGLPPIYGLYASTIPLMVYAVLGTSRQLAVGPVAIVSLLTAGGIGTLVEAGTAEYITLAITLALMVGVIQFLLGVFRLGFLVNFLSHPVISGFTSAAALLIGLSQLKHMLGVPIAQSPHMLTILEQVITQFGNIHGYTLGIGIGSILLILGLKRTNPSIPGPLIAVLLGIMVGYFFDQLNLGVQTIGKIPDGLPSFLLPTVDSGMIISLLPIALTISWVAFMESIAVAKAIQVKHKNYKVSPNQELIGLGLANVVGAFFQSYPVTGGFSRSAVNNQAGAKTGMASIISAVLIILTLLFFTPLFYYLPKAILASVIMVAVVGFIDIKEAIHLWKTNRTDFAMLFVTFISTLGVGIEQGIAVGVVLSLLMVVYRATKPHYATLGNVPGTIHYRNTQRFDEVEEIAHTLIFRFDADLYFVNTNFFKEQIEKEIEMRGDQLKYLILSAESISHVDSSALHMLDELIHDLQDKGIEILFSAVKGPIRDALKRANLISAIGNNRFFMSVEEAVHATYEGLHNTAGEQHSPYTLQTNA